MTDQDRRLRKELDVVARSAAAQLRRAAGRDAARRGIGPALLLLALVPVVLVIVQLVRIALGGDASRLLPWWTVGLAVAPALLVIACRFVAGAGPVARRRALAAVDRRLHSGDRLLTADEFLERPGRDGFMQAAIEDAAEFAERGRAAEVSPPAARITTRLVERAGVPAALLLLGLAFWLSTVQRGVTAPPSDPVAVLPAVAAEETREVDEILPPPEPPAAPEPDADPTRTRREDRTRTRATAPVSRTIPDVAEEAHGSMGVGETSESDQSSSPSNARGAPTSQGQPSRPDDAPKKRTARPGRRPPDRAQPEQPRREANEPTGSTAGQGSSKGSNRNPAVSDWSSRDQVSTPEDDQVDDEPDVEDEEEEQESRGGVQPNLRDRRPPVNRDLRIGFGNRNDPDANGRGGPGQQKKSRGVASFVLGVPIPDRVKGQPNPGKTKVTQQRIEPEPEDSEPTTAEARTPRRGAIEPVFHPVLDPWMRELVRAYFLQQRRTAERGGGISTDPNAASQ